MCAPQIRELVEEAIRIPIVFDDEAEDSDNKDADDEDDDQFSEIGRKFETLIVGLIWDDRHLEEEVLLSKLRKYIKQSQSI